MNEKTTEEQLRDLAAAVIEALTVPRAKRSQDEHKADELMRTRAAFVRGAMRVVIEGVAAEHAASALRSSVAEHLVTYEPFVGEDAEPLSLGVASLPAAWSVRVAS